MKIITMRICRLCKSHFNGRSDKIFCTVKCKTSYHQKLSQVTRDAAYKIDNILHRNRSILLEIMGKKKTQMKVSILTLERKKFNFNYITTYKINKQNKEYRYVYDFSYMLFSNSEVLINRR